MSADFYAAQIPEPRWCLGFKLRPLSLGHLIILRRLGNTFICGGELGFEELATAVLVCANTYEEALAYVDDPALSRFMSKWYRRLSGRDRILTRLGLQKPLPVDFQEESRTFGKYLREGQEGPTYTYDVGNSKQLDCPTEGALMVAIWRTFHLSESEVLNMSFSLCKWRYAIARAMDGKVDLTTSRDIEDAMGLAKSLHKLVLEGRINGFSA